MRILPVSLIQNQPLIEHFPVQQNIRSVDPDLPHGKIRADMIRLHAIYQHPKRDVIQSRILRSPLPNTPLHAADGRMEYICARLYTATQHRSPRPADLCAIKADLRLNLNAPVLPVLRNRYVTDQLQRRICQKRRHFYLFQMNFRYILHPDHLPDTGRLHIPASKTVLHPSLLAPRLLRIKGILHLHCDLIFSILHKLRNIK